MTALSVILAVFLLSKVILFYFPEIFKSLKREMILANKTLYIMNFEDCNEGQR